MLGTTEAFYDAERSDQTQHTTLRNDSVPVLALYYDCNCANSNANVDLSMTTDTGSRIMGLMTAEGSPVSESAKSWSVAQAAQSTRIAHQWQARNSPAFTNSGVQLGATGE